MDWIKNLNRALDYIEENIHGDLDHETIAKQANSSKFHFLRVFYILTAKNLGEYIRERKLSLAAKDVLDGKKVIDVSLMYGYEDHGAFTKAFKRFHNVTPSQALKNSSLLKATPPLRFYLTVKGEEKLNYRIEKREGFTIRGRSVKSSTEDGRNLKELPAFWNSLKEDGIIEKLIPRAGEMGLLGVCYNFNDEMNTFNYMAGVEGDEKDEVTPDILTVPESNWAIFPGKGTMPDSIQLLWKKIFSEWFPATNYVHAKGPELELYLDIDENGIETYEVWIPVVEK